MIPARIESAVQTFNFEGKSPVRTVLQGDEPWFVAADVCAVLEHSNTSKAVQSLDEDERGLTSSYTPSGNQEMLIISESGLYTLIIRSRKPQARPFRRWVTHEVLPTIRRTGSYSIQPALSELQAQMAELQTVMEAKAVRVAATPTTAEKIRVAELSLSIAHMKMAEALSSMWSGMHRLGIHRIDEPNTLPPLS